MKAGNEPEDSGDGKETTQLGTGAAEENPGSSGSIGVRPYRVSPGGI